MCCKRWGVTHGKGAVVWGEGNRGPEHQTWESKDRHWVGKLLKAGFANPRSHKDALPGPRPPAPAAPTKSRELKAGLGNSCLWQQDWKEALAFHYKLFRAISFFHHMCVSL